MLPLFDMRFGAKLFSSFNLTSIPKSTVFSSQSHSIECVFLIWLSGSCDSSPEFYFCAMVVFGQESSGLNLALHVI